MLALSRGCRTFVRALTLLALLMFALSAVPAARAQSPVADHVPGEVLIKFTPQASADHVRSVLQDLGATEVGQLRSIGATRQRITRYEVSAAIARYRGDGQIAFIEPNYILKADRTPNDPLFPQLWGMHNTGQTGGTPGADIQATSAWDVTTGGTSILVGVIDTGLDYNHEDLAGNVWTNPGEIPGNFIDDDGNGFIDDVRGWDFVSNDNDPMDDNGHGTHVSGTIAGIGDNGIGVAGVCWNAKIMPLKFLDSSGSGTTSNAILAVEYATLMHARLTSNSWGGGAFSEALRLAIQAASDAGILFVAAAGNDALDNDLYPHYPANYDVPLLVSVASTDDRDSLSSFSCYGATTVDLGAPGTAILSTTPGNTYSVYSGTSMATPHVSGALALLLSHAPGMTGADARAMLMASVDPISSLAGRTVTGGRLNVFNMLAEPDSLPPDPIADVHVIESNGSWIRLAWTATGDDGSVGNASHYDVRYSTSPITGANFDSATPATGLPYPRPAGSPDSVRVNGLAFGTGYWFAVKALDEFGNASPISNVVTGSTLEPPIAVVTPDSVTADLFTGGQAIRSMNVANTGASDLEFHVEVVDAPGDSGGFAARSRVAVTPAGQPLRAVGHRVPLDRLSGTGIRASVQLAAAPTDRETGGRPGKAAATAQPIRTLGTEVFGSMQNVYFGGPRTRGNIFHCTTATWLDEQRLYLEPSAPTQLWFVVYEGLQQVGTYRLIAASQAPNAGPGPGWYSSGPVGARLEAGRWYLVATSFEQPSYYYNETTVTPYPYPTSFGELVAGAGYDWAPTASFPPDSTQEVPNFAFGSTVAYYQTLVTRPGPHWLSADPADATVPAGTNADVSVVLDATGLNGGDYRGALAVHSNDPVLPVAHVGAHLHVTGAPDLALSADSLEFGTVFTGDTRTDTLIVRNIGTDELDVTGVTAPLPFTADPSNFTLSPGGSRNVLVHLTPTAPGPLSGTLTVTSNDPDQGVQLVTLAGLAADPPILTVSPDSLVEDLLTGGQATHTLQLGNTGTSDLLYLISLTAGGEPVPPLQVSRRLRATTPAVAAAAGAPSRPYAGGVAPRRGPLAPEAPLAKGEHAAALSLRVLIVNVSSDVSELVSRLSAMPDIAAVDEYIVGPGVPGLDLLRQYNAAVVVTSTSTSLADPLGNVLADFVDAGGGVVMTLASFVNGYGVGGRLLSDGYMPLVNGAGPVGSSTLGVFNAAHPIMRNIHTLSGDVLAQADLSTGSEMVAQYANGLPLVATKGTHVVGMNVFFGAPGYWFGDAPMMVRNAVAWSGGGSWLSADPVSGIVPSGTHADVTVSFDATGLYGGDYRANLEIQTNDPVHLLTDVPAHLHVTGAPDITISTTAFAFGTRYTGTTTTDSMIVRNDGTDVLDVTSLATAAPFTVTPASFTLAPTASQVVLVGYAPTAPGPSAGTLTITSNDADEGSLAVILGGNAVDPPIVTVDPDSLAADLLTGGQSVQSIHIGNTGASDLQYQVTAVAADPSGGRPAVKIPAALAGVTRTDRALPADAVIRAVPSTMAGSRVLIVEDQYPWGLASNESVLTSLGIPYDVIYPTQLPVTTLSQYRVVIVPSVQATSTYQTLAANAAQLESFVAHGGVLEFHAAGQSSGSDSWLVTLPGGMHASQASYAQANVVLMPQHPIVAGIPTTFTGSAASHAYLQSIPAQAQEIVADDSSRTNLAVYRYGSGHVVSGGQTFEFAYAYGWPQGPMLSNLIPYSLALGGVGWLAMNPAEGTVPPGGAVDITATFDATGLYGGDYHADVLVASNDPVHPVVSRPAHLHVTGAPDITLSATSIAFGTLFTGTSRVDSLVVRNDGTDVLDVTSLATAAPYSVSPANFSLAPTQSQVVFVGYAPTAPGVSPGTLTITSNDADEGSLTVTLTGSAVDPPIVTVNPDSLVADLLTGGHETRTLTVGNTGASDLHYHVAAVPSATLLVRPVSPLAAKAAARTGQVRSDRAPQGAAIVSAVPSTMAGAQVLIIEDQLPWGYNSIEYLLSVNAIPYDVINSYQVASTNLHPYRLVIVPSVQPNPFYSNVAAESTKFNAYVAQGGVLEFHAAGQSYGSDSWLVTLPGGMHISAASYASTNTVLMPQHPIVAGVPSPFYGYSASHAYLTSIPGNAHPIVQDDAGHTNLAEYAYGAGHVICGGQTFEIAWSYGWQQGPMLPNMLTYALSLGGAGWVSLNPSEGTVPPGGTADITATFDATGLYGGDYRADLVVESDDPVHPAVSRPAHLHVTGAPDITLSATSIAFGTLFTGTSRTDSLIVTNDGTDVLDVSSLATAAPYSVSPTSFSLAPTQSQVVFVGYAPTAPGPSPGTLTITSNDGDEGSLTVTLTGSAVDPPILTVNPDSLSADLFTGAQVTRTLHIGNPGASDLDYQIAAVPGALFAAVAAPATMPAALRLPLTGSKPAAKGAMPDTSGPRSDKVPHGPDAIAAVPSTMAGSQVLLIEDQIPWGYYSNESVLYSRGIPFDVINSYQLASTDLGQYRLVIVPSVQPTTEYTNLAARSAQIATFVSQGGVLEFHAAGDPYSSNSWVVTLPGGMRISQPWYAYTNYVLQPSHPIVAGIPSPFTGYYASQAYLDSIPGGAAIVATDDYSHPDLAVYAYGAGHVICGGQTFELGYAYAWPQGPMLSNMIPYALTLAGVGWLGVNPAQGTVPPGGTADIAVTFDATGMSGGDFFAHLNVQSNDPMRPTAGVAARLHVTGVPDITLSRTSLAFGTVYTGLFRNDTLGVRNDGTDVLDVSGLSVAAPYSVTPTSFSLPPGASQTVTVRFSPTSTGPFPGTLTVTSNDPDEGSVAVTLTGTAVDPPLITINPDSLAAILNTGEHQDTPLHVTNAGGADLTFSVGTTIRSLSATVYGATEPAAGKGEPDPRPSILGRGGPDTFGYVWRDSDEPGGPAFEWVDITGIGTALPLSGDDAVQSDVPIGFDFPYYGNTFTSVNVCTNGFLSFTSASNSYYNYPLPNPSAPQNLVALMWDDLYAGTSTIYAYRDAGRFILAWVGVTQLGSGVPNTFEVILQPNGRIRYQYLSGGGFWDPSATVGIQNANGSSGLTVEFNTSTYLHDQLAVDFGMASRFLSVSPTSGTLPPGGSTDLMTRMDAAGLTAGDYLGELTLTSNDPVHPSVVVPARLHVIGAPDITLSATSLEFGTLFVGGGVTDTLFVRNDGAELLNVTSLGTAAPFSVLPTSFTLAPGVSQAVQVRFDPTASGPASGTLTVASNDPDEASLAVTLAGVATDPPILSVNPDSLVLLLAPNDRDTRALTIANAGAGELQFAVSVNPGPNPLARAVAAKPVVGPLSYRAGKTTSDRMPPGEQPAAAAAVLTPGAKALIVEDVLPWAVNVNETILAANGIPFDVIPSAQLAATDLSHYQVMIVPSVQPTSTYTTLASREGQIDAFVAGGGVLEFHGAGLSSGSDPWLVPLPGGVTVSHASYSNTNHVVSPLNPIVAGIPETFMGSYASHAYVQSIPPDAEAVVADEYGHPTLAVYRFGAGRVICGGQPFEFAYAHGWVQGPMLSNMLPFALRLAEVGWLQVLPSAGVVAPFGSRDVTVDVNALGMAPGDYHAFLQVSSNDPAHPLRTIPVHLVIADATAIDVALESATAAPGLVKLAWFASGPTGLAATVQRRTPVGEWAALGTVSADGQGYLRYEDTGVAEGGRYAYRLSFRDGGVERFTGEAWVDVPVNARLALNGLAGNPVVSDIIVSFSLPDSKPATLELLDVFGRRIDSREVGSLGAGTHTLPLGAGTRPAPGVYLVRLNRDGRSLVTRAAVLR